MSNPFVFEIPCFTQMVPLPYEENLDGHFRAVKLEAITTITNDCVVLLP